MNMSQGIKYLVPELLVLAGAIIALVVDGISKKEERWRTPYILVISQIFALVVLFLLAFITFTGSGPRRLFWNTYTFDYFAVFFKAFFLIVGIFTTYLATQSEIIKSQKAGGEFASLVGFAVIGGMVTASAGDFITLILGLETVSMLGYALAGFTRTKLAREASAKYVLYGAFSTAVSLFGLGMIYWAGVGQVEFKKLAYALTVTPYKAFAFAGIILFLVGLFFKASLVPFHMWCPDVYQGSPTLVTAYLSVGPKAVGFLAIIRVVFDAFSTRHAGVGWIFPKGIDVPLFIAVISALTMTVGNFSALVQKDVKRMLAYSSIAHAGYMLSALAASTEVGVSAIMYYLLAYLVMNFGAFATVEAVEFNGRGTSLDAFSGLGWKSPVLGVSMGIFLLSLTGIPPFAGFVGKVLAFGALIKKKILWLAILGVINSVVSLGYYGLILKKMFLEESKVDFSFPFSYTSLLALLGVMTILLGIFFNPLLEYMSQSVRFLGVLF